MEMLGKVAMTMWSLVVVLLFVDAAVKGSKYYELFKYFAGLFVMSTVCASALFFILRIWS